VAEKGSTETSTIGKRQDLINARNFSAECLESRYLLQTNPIASLPHNTFVNIIKGATDKYGLEEGELKLYTLRGRFRKNISYYFNGRGVNSRMFHVENIIVSMIIRRAAMRQPYTVRECLELANSLIDKSVTQVQLVQWKQKNVRVKFHRRECRQSWIEVVAQFHQETQGSP
jgi:hypothetical protein